MPANPETKRHLKRSLLRVKSAPRYAGRKLKATIRRLFSKSKAAIRKARHASSIISNKNKRQFYIWERGIKKFEQQGDWDKSVKLWIKLLALQGDGAFELAVVRLSRAYQEIGNYDSARQVVAEAIASYPTRNGVTDDDLRRWKILSQQKAEVSFLERIKNIEEYKKQVQDYRNMKQERPKNQLKIALFSAVSGSYDTIKPPAIIDSRFDYILFTDAPVELIGIYKVRPLPYLDAVSTRSARFVKTNPHNLLNDYDVAVWVDANILITGDIYPIIESVLKTGKPFGAMRHASRTSPYEEMAVCISHGRDDPEIIKQQRSVYKQEGYDSDQLIETNVLVYDLRDKKLEPFLNEWWNQIDRYSYRDQFSINYSLDKHGINWHRFTDYPNTARNHPALALMDHGKGSDGYKKLMERLDTKMVFPEIGEPYHKVKSERINDQQTKISVVVCVHNAFDDVKKCLNSIKNNWHKHLSLIVIDDGSDEQTTDYLKSFTNSNSSWSKLIRHDRPIGYTKSANEGLKKSATDFTIILNSDTIVTKDWAQKMADVAANNKGVGIVGPMSSAASWQSVPDFEAQGNQTIINKLPDGLSPEDMNRYCEKWSYSEDIPRVPLVHGFCFGVTKEVVDSVGFFDDKSFPRGYGEENDYCFRTANSGFHLAIATHTYVFHAKSKSFVSEERRELMKSGMKTLRGMHGNHRTDRAIKTMRQNSVLVELRQKFGKTYRRLNA